MDDDNPAPAFDRPNAVRCIEACSCQDHRNRTIAKRRGGRLEKRVSGREHTPNPRPIGVSEASVRLNGEVQVGFCDVDDTGTKGLTFHGRRHRQWRASGKDRFEDARLSRHAVLHDND